MPIRFNEIAPRCRSSISLRPDNHRPVIDSHATDIHRPMLAAQLRRQTRSWITSRLRAIQEWSPDLPRRDCVSVERTHAQLKDGRAGSRETQDAAARGLSPEHRGGCGACSAIDRVSERMGKHDRLRRTANGCSRRAQAARDRSRVGRATKRKLGCRPPALPPDRAPQLSQRVRCGAQAPPSNPECSLPRRQTSRATRCHKER